MAPLRSLGNIRSAFDDFYARTGTTLGGAGSTPIDATGGSKSPTSRSGYIVHTFSHPNGAATSPHPATFTVNSGSGTIEYMILGGGGGGNHLGGGGAGGLIESTVVVTPGTYAITVGHGGAKGNWTGGITASAGGNSSIGSLGKNATAYGGGIGALIPASGGNGGCGGGSNAANPDVPGGAGLNPDTPAPVAATFPAYDPGTLQGGNGGSGNVASLHGGGGGGAYGPGAGQGGQAPPTAPSSGNNATGGSGRNVSITGSTVQYGGGGGGGAYDPGSGGYKNNGGAGGGGRGGYGATGGEGGTNGLGGGGGGAGSNPHAGSPQGGGRGGNGIVIIAYPIS